MVKGKDCWSHVRDSVALNNTVIGFNGLRSFALSFSLFLSSNPFLTLRFFLKGNGGDADNCNYDMYSNAPFVINVGSHGPNGVPTSYSEPCSALVSSSLFITIFYFLLC